ncbi:MAG: hypothetical protein M1825_005534 [Sarcosagium campestre]|nr:MAG: hypothetical protein M1825_005534 [Sarcosagium campestre]
MSFRARRNPNIFPCPSAAVEEAIIVLGLTAAAAVQWRAPRIETPVLALLRGANIDVLVQRQSRRARTTPDRTNPGCGEFHAGIADIERLRALQPGISLEVDENLASFGLEAAATLVEVPYRISSWISIEAANSSV